MNLEKEEINWKNFFEYTFIGIGVIGIITICLQFIYSKIGLDFDISSNFNVNAFSVVTILIIAPIFEELIFRKAILNCSKKLRKKIW